MVSPNAFAALRLTTNSNVVGCSTGKSAGLAPLRNFAGVNADLANTFRDVGSVAHQPAGFDEFPLGENHRNAVARRQDRKLDDCGSNC
jgi:hypothetical protein